MGRDSVLHQRLSYAQESSPQLWQRLPTKLEVRLATRNLAHIDQKIKEKTETKEQNTYL